LFLSESQIIALREEEEESQSQSQPTLNQPGGPVNDSTMSDSLRPIVRDAKVATNVSTEVSLGSLEQSIDRPFADIQPINLNVNNGDGSGANSQGVHSQSNVSNVPDPSMQDLGAVDDSPSFRFSPLPASPHKSSFNPNPSASAISSSKSPQMEKSMQGEGVNEDFTEDAHRFDPRIVLALNPSDSSISSSKSPQTEKSVKIGSTQIGKPGTSSMQQHSPSRSEPPRSGNGTLASRRAFEARIRLDELRRAGKRFGHLAKGHTTLKASQSSERPSPHVVFKQIMDQIESPNGSQVTHFENSGNQISANALPVGNRRAVPSESQEGLAINKLGQDANVGSLPRAGGVRAGNVLVVRSDVTGVLHCTNRSPDVLSS
jgi:hypothetical protein